MEHRPIHPESRSYAQAHEVRGANRLLFISGQVPETADGVVPADFRAQCELVWDNIEAQLREAGMTLAHLVKVTTFLSDRRYREENADIRHSRLSGHAPALTVIICGIYEERWLLEIEAVAAE
jgi:2-iminobutanoate/2-iminopropanoate deaminase